MTNSFGLTTLRKAPKVFPGLMMCVVVALAAKLICEHFGAPVMLMALLIGMAFNFLTEDYGKCVVGIEFSALGSLFNRSPRQATKCFISVLAASC
jgi:uncharacterized membrane protein YadS